MNLPDAQQIVDIESTAIDIVIWQWIDITTLPHIDKYRPAVKNTLSDSRHGPDGRCAGKAAVPFGINDICYSGIPLGPLRTDGALRACGARCAGRTLFATPG